MIIDIVNQTYQQDTYCNKRNIAEHCIAVARTLQIDTNTGMSVSLKVLDSVDCDKTKTKNVASIQITT